jgi:TonB family protein
MRLIARALTVTFLVLMLAAPVHAACADIVIERERRSPGAAYAKPPEWYARIVKERIAERWSPPTSSAPNLISIFVITITPEGHVTEEVARSSGDLNFDAAATRAIKNAAPFPRLPDGHRAERARLTIEFR